jgi:hypothetical protein
LIATETPVTRAAEIGVAPGVRVRVPPPTGTVPVIVPRLTALAPVMVTETVFEAQPASRLVTVTVETL